MAKKKAPREDAQRRDIPFKLVKLSITETGTFEGYGSVFGVIDSYGTVVDAGAFAKTLQENMPKLLWQHDWANPIGIYTKAYEDNIGLRLEGQLNMDVQQGREAYALLKQGALEGLSIGFYPVRTMYDDDDVEHFTEVGLMEVSVVTFQANQEATVTSVKSIRDMFHDLDDGQRKQVAAFINSFHQSPADSAPSSEVAASTSAEHPEEQHADKTPTDAPQLEENLVLHSLEMIDQTLTRLLKNNEAVK